MKVLFLNQTFHPDVAASAQYSSDLALALVDRGHQVTVVCATRPYDDGPSETYAARESWKGIDIHRISGTRFGKAARWRRAVDFGSYLASCSLHLLTLGRHDVVIGMTSPPLISWIGAMFTRLKGGRFVFWVLDLNPDEALAAGWLRADSLVTRTLQWILNDSLRQSSLIIALDSFMSDRIQRKGIDANRIEVLPPWSLDESLRYDDEGRRAFRAAQGLEGKFVVMYSGNHSPCHPLETLVDAATSLRDRDDIVFAFVGGGSEQARVKRIAAERNLPNVRVLPYQPLAQLSASLSSADLHVVVMGDAFVGMIHPSKVYNIRALGIPYLYIGPADSHVTELRPAHVAAHGDVAGVVARIEAAVRNGIGARETPGGLENFSRDKLVGQFVSSLERVGSATVGQSSEGVPARPASPSSPARPSRPSRPSRPTSVSAP